MDITIKNILDNLDSQTINIFGETLLPENEEAYKKLCRPIYYYTIPAAKAYRHGRQKKRWDWENNTGVWLAYTENFTSFSNPRSYAVYVGVVPFDHTSGKSIHGRKRVSHIVNKELKQELNQAARSAIVWDKEMNSYAENKLKTKCYKIVLNNVKFKLILRIFAVVKKRENVCGKL